MLRCATHHPLPLLALVGLGHKPPEELQLQSGLMTPPPHREGGGCLLKASRPHGTLFSNPYRGSHFQKRSPRLSHGPQRGGRARSLPVSPPRFALCLGCSLLLVAQPAHSHCSLTPVTRVFNPPPYDSISGLGHTVSSPLTFLDKSYLWHPQGHRGFMGAKASVIYLRGDSLTRPIPSCPRSGCSGHTCWDWERLHICLCVALRMFA